VEKLQIPQWLGFEGDISYTLVFVLLRIKFKC